MARRPKSYPSDVTDEGGSPWRHKPRESAPWQAIQQQTQRRIAAGCFGLLIHDLRALLLLAASRQAVTSAVIIDSRTL